MSRPPFDPTELDGNGELRRVAARLDEYVRATSGTTAPDRLTGRVMAALPERRETGVFAPFAALVRAARAAPLAAALVLVVGFGGVLAAGQVTGILRVLPVGTPEPVVSPAVTQTPGPSPSATGSGTPGASASGAPSPAASPSDSPTPLPTPVPFPSPAPTGTLTP